MAELEAEVRALSRLLNCGVCHVARKDTLLTKCAHLFCSGCVKKNLETRHRKCPGCGAPFGAADVRTVYIA